MNEQMKEIAARCVAEVVRDAMSESSPPSADELKDLAEGVADALISAFSKLEGADV